MNFCRVVVLAGLSCTIAGFSPAVIGAENQAWLAQAADPGTPTPTPAIPPAPSPTPATPAAATPASPAEAKKSEGGGVGWYIGTGIGGSFNEKYKLNGRTLSFSDTLQGTTDNVAFAFNLINVGVTLGPNFLIGFSGSLAAKSGTNSLTSKDAKVQINNYFAEVTWFPVEKGFFLRGGGGPSNIQIDTGNGAGAQQTSGYGYLLGGGYALQLGQHHNITFTFDTSRQSYGGSTTRPSSSEFSAVYLGYMYRH